jgi:hypothetical protein
MTALRVTGADAILFAVTAAVGFGVAAVANDVGRRALRSTTAVGLISAAAAAAAVLRGTHPTHIAAWDALVVFVGVGGVTWAASFARRRFAVLGIGLAAAGAFAGGASAGLAGLAVGTAAMAGVLPVRTRAIKAAAAGLTAHALLAARAGADQSRLLLAAACLLAVAASAIVQLRDRQRRFAVGALAVGGLAAGVFSFGTYAAARSARPVLEHAAEDARLGFERGRTGDTTQAATNFASAEAGFGTAVAKLKSWYARPGEFVPVAAQNKRAALALASSGASLSREASAALGANAAEALRVRNGTVDVGRVKGLSPVLRRLVAALSEAESKLLGARSSVLLDPVGPQLARLTSEVANARGNTQVALDAAQLVPRMLGDGQTRTYLLAIQNNSESRATGGIIGSYGLLKAENGHLSLGSIGRGEDLNRVSAKRTLTGLAEYRRRYGPFDPEGTWQNVNLSPDGPTVGEAVRQLFPQITGQHLDGVVFVDPFALAALLNLTGPVSVPAWPRPLDSASATSVLLHDQYVQFPKAERVDFLAGVARAIFDRLNTADLPTGPSLAKALGDAVRGRHLFIYSADLHEQRFLRERGIAGEMPPVVSDFFGVVTQNASGNKIDWFFHRTINYDARVQKDGLHATVTLTLRNDAPPTGEPDYVIAGAGALPPQRGVNRMILSIYSPHVLRNATRDGAPLKFDPARELDRNVYSIFVDVAPNSEATITLTLDGFLDKPSAYKLVMFEQPLPRPDEVHTHVRAAAKP